MGWDEFQGGHLCEDVKTHQLVFPNSEIHFLTLLWPFTPLKANFSPSLGWVSKLRN